MIIRRKPLRRGGPIRRVSTRRAKQLREYSKARKRFLAERPICEVWLAKNNWAPSEAMPGYYTPIGTLKAHFAAETLVTRFRALRSVDVHHVRGRVGTMLLDEGHWLAVSRAEHEWIHQHPREAREKGWLR